MADHTRIRVVFDGHVLTPHRSGIGEYSWHLLQALLRGYQDRVALHLYLPSGIIPIDEADRIDDLARDVQDGDFYRLHHQWRLPRLLRRGTYDLYHSPEFLFPLRCPLPVVSTIYDLIPLVHPEYIRKSMKVRLLPVFRQLVRTTVRRSARVITISECSRGDILRLAGADPGKVDIALAASTLIPHTGETLPPDTRLQAGRYLLYVGRHDPYKGLGFLLHAFAKLVHEGDATDVMLAIAGKRDARYSYDTLVKELGLEDRVVFLGYVSRGQLSTLYAQALGLVFPSLYEGFGLPLLDAMAHGTPVLSSNRASLPEVGGEAAAYVDPEKHEEFVSTLKSFMENSSLRQILINKGHERVQQFTWDRAAQATVETYVRAVRK